MDTPKQGHRLTIKFDVTPVTDHRPRFNPYAKAGQKFAYSNPKTKNYKALLLAELSRQLEDPISRETILSLSEKPIAITATFSMPIPQRLLKKRSNPWQTALPTGKPDVDNLTKAIKDVLSGQVYRDDSLVTHLLVRKIYDERPYVKIVIEEASIETNKHLFDSDTV